MTKEKPLASDRHGDYWWVDTRRLIEEEDYNRREDYGDLPKLAKEIKASGLNNLEPLICYKKGEFYVVLKGYRRRRALKLLEEEGEILIVRILLAQKGYNKEHFILDQITGNEGKPYTPWEQAKVLRDLRGLGWSEKDMIERSGLSKVYVKRLLSLADAPQKLINLVREGRIKGTLAMDMIAENKVEEVIRTAEKAPVQETQDDIGDLFTQPNPAPPPAAKITKSDIQRPNSVKVFKKWVPAVEEEKLSDDKKEILHWLKRLVDGELTVEDFNNFFS